MWDCRLLLEAVDDHLPDHIRLKVAMASGWLRGPAVRPVTGPLFRHPRRFPAGRAPNLDGLVAAIAASAS